eukprot:COSAG01_NODE_736_length_13947_cov_174.337449_17_plen_181_part_00
MCGTAQPFRSSLRHISTTAVACTISVAPLQVLVATRNTQRTEAIPAAAHHVSPALIPRAHRGSGAVVPQPHTTKQLSRRCVHGETAARGGAAAAGRLRAAVRACACACVLRGFRMLLLLRVRVLAALAPAAAAARGDTAVPSSRTRVISRTNFFSTYDPIFAYESYSKNGIAVRARTLYR